MSLPAAYFNDLYAKNADPWGFETREYEARKYALTLASLPCRHYGRVFEPGCSIGVLTRMLSMRADEVVATEISEAALDTARHAGLPGNVTLELASVPCDWPSDHFDLIVFSELGYYFDRSDLDEFVRQAVSSLEPSGHLVAVHWRAPVIDYPGDAERVHAALAVSPLNPLAHYEDDLFLLDVFGQSPQSRLVGPEDGRK
jgi:SAM-dependent methyltransferase